MTDASPDWADLRRLAEDAANCDDMGGVWAYGAWSEKSNDAVVIAATKYADADFVPLTGSVEYDPDEIYFQRVAYCEDDLSGITRASYISAANPATILALLDERAALIAEAARLREALRPFGVAALGIPPEVADSSDGLRFARSTPAAAFRRARSLTGGDHG